jgi:hypothetical protein
LLRPGRQELHHQAHYLLVPKTTSSTVALSVILHAKIDERVYVWTPLAIVLVLPRLPPRRDEREDELAERALQREQPPHAPPLEEPAKRGGPKQLVLDPSHGNLEAPHHPTHGGRHVASTHVAEAQPGEHGGVEVVSDLDDHNR